MTRRQWNYRICFSILCAIAAPLQFAAWAVTRMPFAVALLLASTSFTSALHFYPWGVSRPAPALTAVRADAPRVRTNTRRATRNGA